MFRGDPKSFASDEKALALSKMALDKNFDKEMDDEKRAFFYLPLMHSEDLADQNRCVELFSTHTWGPKFAIMHRDIIKRFNHFPHRNEVLGRPSTDEEVEFLKQEGSSF